MLLQANSQPSSAPQLLHVLHTKCCACKHEGDVILKQSRCVFHNPTLIGSRQPGIRALLQAYEETQECLLRPRAGNFPSFPN